MNIDLNREEMSTTKYRRIAPKGVIDYVIDEEFLTECRRTTQERRTERKRRTQKKKPVEKSSNKSKRVAPKALDYVIDDDFTVDVFEDVDEKTKVFQAIKEEIEEISSELHISIKQEQVDKEPPEKRPETQEPKKKAPFTCKLCSFVTKRKSHWIRHVKMHEFNVDNFTCACGFMAPSKPSLTNHLIKCCRNEKKIFECSECSFRTLKFRYLNKHKYRHDPNRQPMKCSLCSYTTKQSRSHMRQHMSLRHSDAYKCDKCGYNTYDKKTWSSHVKSHKD